MSNLIALSEVSQKMNDSIQKVLDEHKCSDNPHASALGALEAIINITIAHTTDVPKEHRQRILDEILYRLNDR